MIKSIAENVSIRNLYFIDAIGALLTLSLLLFVLIPLNDLFGMPVDTLRILATIASLILINSVLCALIQPKRPDVFLALIATANLLYISLTLIFLIGHSNEIKAIGWIFFLGESAIINFLALVEFQKSKAVKT